MRNPVIQELIQLAKNVVVDGEIVVMKKWKVDFHAQLEKLANLKKQHR